MARPFEYMHIRRDDDDEDDEGDNDYADDDDNDDKDDDDGVLRSSEVPCPSMCPRIRVFDASAYRHLAVDFHSL